jgi:hypothetical protein
MEITVPIDERDLLIGVLRNDARLLSHFWGAQIHYLQRTCRDEDRAQQRLDEILGDACERFASDPGTLARIVRTWLVTYNVEPDATRLESFERFHDLVGNYVIKNHSVIEVFNP